MAAYIDRASLTAAITMLAAVGATAQSVTPQDPAAEFYFDLSTGLWVTDNYESLEEPAGDTSLWRSDLAFGYFSETRAQRLAFELGGRLEVGEFAEDPDRSADFINPFATLDYQRENSTSFFLGALSYRENDNGIDVRRQVDSSTDLIVDQGTRADSRARIEMETGIGAPVRTAFDLEYHQRRFFDTTEPDLTDQDTISIDGELGLALNQTTELLFVAFYRDRDDIEDLKADETLAGVGVGLSGEIGKDLSYRTVLRFERDERTETIDDERVTEITESPTLDLSFTKDRPNGSYRFSLGGELDSNGVRTTARVGRDLELRSGALDFSVGLTRLESGDVNPVGTLQWVQDFKRSQFAVDFSSRVRTDDDGDEILLSRLGFRYDRELTALDGFRLEMDVASTEGLDGNTEDRQQAGMSVSYFRDITSDWSFVTGYNYRFSDGSNRDTITKNEVFARIDRRFSIRP